MRSQEWDAAAAMLIVLAACGGQGSGGPEAAWVTPRPPAEAGGADVHISGTVSHL